MGKDRGLVGSGLTPLVPSREAVGVDATPSEEARYAALGRACESNGLGWYGDDGQMLFQAPADVIEEQAYRRGWNDREADLLAGAARILPGAGVPHD